MADEKQAAEFVLPCPDPEGCEIFKKMNGLTTRLAAAEAENNELERDCLAVIDERDAVENYILKIIVALGGSTEWPEGSDMEVEALNRATDIAEQLAAAEAKCDGATCVSKETLIATETERDEALGRLAALRRDLASRDTEIACHRSMRKALDRIVQDFVAKWQEQKG